LNAPVDMALFMGKYDLRLIYTKKSQPKIINSKIDKKTTARNGAQILCNIQQ
jgi:hypothetical protein